MGFHYEAKHRRPAGSSVGRGWNALLLPCLPIFVWVCSVGLGAESERARRGPDPALLPQGRFVYERNCVVCHGRNGDGRGEMAGSLPDKPRPFTSGIFKFKSTPRGLLPVDEDLQATVARGVSGTAMPMFSTLTERENRAVVEYLKTFSKRWLRPENHGAQLPVPSTPEWFKEPARFTAARERGAVLFTQLCAPCHGERGAGDGPSAGTLEDAWGNATRPADLRRGFFKRISSLGELHRTLMLGIDGTPMPAYGEAVSEVQLWEVIAHVRWLGTNQVDRVAR